MSKIEFTVALDGGESFTTKIFSESVEQTRKSVSNMFVSKSEYPFVLESDDEKSAVLIPWDKIAFIQLKEIEK